MGLKKTLAWASSEWGVFQRGMSTRDTLRWLGQWIPFGARTVGYGTVSLTLGPLTRDHRASTWAMKRWSRVSLRALNIETEVRGARNAPPGGLMYASNHQSLLDILVLGACLPGDIKWAAKRSIMQVPFLGWHLALSGHVPVDRKAGKKAVVEVIKRFEQVMRDDKPLLIFPEGTRSEDGQLQGFKDGGFYAAVRAGKPVVPVVLDGTYAIMGKNAVDTGDLKAGARQAARRVPVLIGPPIEAGSEGSERLRVHELRDRCHQVIADMLAELRGEGAPSDGG